LSAGKLLLAPLATASGWLTPWVQQTGSLAVPNGRDVAEPINYLLTLPFVLRIATQDWHPTSHVSFAANHPAPNNQPFVSTMTIANPENPAETETTRLWPIHCVQESKGATLIPELDVGRVQRIVQKGMDDRVEAYSAFGPPFRDPPVGKSDLADVLKNESITHVYVVGLALDYCVKCTAIDAAEEGFQTYVVREGTKAVDPGEWGNVEKEMAGKNVVMVDLSGEEVGKVKALSG
jgi:nicotinamidase-related amidase